MNNKITYNQIIERLEESGIPYKVMHLSDEFLIIVSQLGGRIFGPFLGEEGESIFWASKIFSDAEGFKKFVEAKNWNLGGDRIWIAPELQYNVHDRNRFFQSYDLPQQVDPGNYLLSTISEEELVLSQNMKLKIYSDDGLEDKELFIERRIRKIEDPLLNISNHEELLNNVKFAGFVHDISLSEKNEDGLMSETWNLTQVNPGGEILIPTTSRVEYTDYYEPIKDNYQTIKPHQIRLKITGYKQYKVGYKAFSIFGRVGYLNKLDDEQYYLLIRDFSSNPIAKYTMEPAEQPGNNGYPLHIYNDNGDFGGFAEIECSGQPIGGITKRNCSDDRISTWLYQGSKNKIKRISEYIL